MLGVEPSTLRYWEDVFPQLRPHRRRTQRLYRQSDLQLLTNIRRLLYELGYTIRGAREVLSSAQQAPAADAASARPPEKSGPQAGNSKLPGAVQSSAATFRDGPLESARRELGAIVERLRSGPQQSPPRPKFPGPQGGGRR